MYVLVYHYLCFSGVFLNQLIAPIPFFWKVPVLLIGAAVILLLVVMACGYRDEIKVYIRLIVPFYQETILEILRLENCYIFFHLGT